MGNDYVERERKSNIDINERRRLLRTKQSNEMNRLRQRQQQQIHQLIQKHRDQSTELERQISDEAHWSRCEKQNPHCSIASVNRSEWRVEKWSGWRESNPLSPYNSIDDRLRHIKTHCLSLNLNESHIVSVRGLVSISFPFSFQFFTRLAAVFAKEVSGFEV